MSGNKIRQLLTGIKPVPSMQPNLKRRVENSGHSNSSGKNYPTIYIEKLEKFREITSQNVGK